MMHEKYDYLSSVSFAKDLFEKRMLKYIEDDLFVTDFSKEKSKIFHEKSINKLMELY
jgi:hypothetical protein